jgi:hypothetical protein
MHLEHCSPKLERLAECRLPLLKPCDRGEETGTWLPSFPQNLEPLTLQNVELARDLGELRLDESNIRVILLT